MPLGSLSCLALITQVLTTNTFVNSGVREALPVFSTPALFVLLGTFGPGPWIYDRDTAHVCVVESLIEFVPLGTHSDVVCVIRAFRDSPWPLKSSSGCWIDVIGLCLRSIHAESDPTAIVIRAFRVERHDQIRAFRV